jgi:hypothetical protein
MAKPLTGPIQRRFAGLCPSPGELEGIVSFGRLGQLEDPSESFPVAAASSFYLLSGGTWESD